MDDIETSRTAAVAFRSAREAERRIAGVAVAARIARDMAKAGFSHIKLQLPAGETLSGPAGDDLQRLAGSARISVGAVDADLDVLVVVPGSKLVPEEALRRLRAGLEVDLDAAAIDLDRRRATTEILKATGKSGDGPVSRWLNRPISRRISALLLHLPGMRPGHATAGTALLAAAMFAALVTGGAQGLIVGALLFQAASVFDGVDGEIARATFRTSDAGAMLDTAVDVATNCLLIVGLTINLFVRGNEEAVPLAAWGFTLFVLGLGAIARRATRAGGPFSLDSVKHDYRGRFSGRAVRSLISAATIVSSRDFFALLFAVLMVVGLPEAVLYLFAAAATVWILFVAGAARLPSLASPGA